MSRLAAAGTGSGAPRVRQARVEDAGLVVADPHAARSPAKCSRLNSAVYAYSVPDMKYLGVVNLGGKGAGWLTISPDSKTAYIANEHSNSVSAVDIPSLKEVAVIPVGYAPARNTTWMAP